MSHGLIDPSKLPGLDLDLAGVAQAATDISSRAGSIRQAGADVASSWSALPGSYESTGAESVYVAMNPVRDASDRVGGDLASVASALSTWATTVQPILTRVADLRTDAEAFVVEANTFQPRVTTTGNLAVTFLPVQVDNWWEDPEMVQRNADLVDQGYLLGEQLRVANEDLANAIRRAAGLSTTTVAHAATTAPDNLQADWGSASPREESCAEKTIGFPMHLTGGVLTGAWDMVGGLGMLLGGYDFKSWPPPTWAVVGDLMSGDIQGAADRGGDWLSGWGQSWLGLGHLATGLSMGFLAPVMSEVVAPGQIADLKSKGADTGFLEWQQQWARDSYRSYIDLFGGFVGYHAPEEWWNASPEQWGEGWSDWGKDPGGTAGTSLFNVASIFLPAKGGGALLDGVRVGRGAEGLADDLGRMGAGERDLGRTPLRPGSLADDVAKAGGVQDDLAKTLGRSPLNDGGSLLDDIRGGHRLARPDVDLPRVHADEPDLPPSRIADPDVPTAHHVGGDAPSGHAGETAPTGIGNERHLTDQQPHVPPHTNLHAPPPHAGPDAPRLPDLSAIDSEFRMPDGAVDPLRLDEWARKVSEAYPRLTPSEIKGIYDYTTEPGVHAMNPYLRDPSHPSPFDVGSVETRIENATSGLSKLPAEPGRTYRGVTLDQNFLDTFQIGRKWHDDTFMSSSKTPRVAEDFSQQALEPGEAPGVITIDGLTGSDVMPISRYQHESEILFQRGTEFDVVSKFQDVEGIWRIHLREIPAPGAK